MMAVKRIWFGSFDIYASKHPSNAFEKQVIESEPNWNVWANRNIIFLMENVNAIFISCQNSVNCPEILYEMSKISFQRLNWLHKNILRTITFRVFKYSEIPLLRPPKIKTFYPLKALFAKFKLFFFPHFLHPVSLWLETTFGTVQKWSLRPLLDSPKGGLNIGILLYYSQLFYSIWI